ncbi:efflux RND transporter permease subunit [Aestuariispira insulae]|uniref:HAE1 family hydrophobic/amphiphilic exporter-1 n=1 Tax=Aestuariispira insulae TaxID=1461337 RepID=A0A3D9HSW1_9PROT|nr:efflux RND transporter permease subunit [Aestuariispira insulae]RED52505.1 HAE1 family hydrophobic/amphiphilic exporter-1 [Aestuariispira insulae]
MNLISLSIQRPVAVIAAVLMAVMFGAVALTSIPIQLAPDVSRPVITVSTNWPGAAPAEVEREIVNEQEDVLKGLEGMKSMTSSASNGQARITLEFDVGQDMGRALLLTANRLDRVSGYPDEADEPTLATVGSEDNAIAWFRIRKTDNETGPAIGTYRDFVVDVVKERIERVPGVSEVNVYGGGEREMQVVVEPALLARYGLTVSNVLDRLRAANASVTGGKVDEGKRRYVVRTDNEFSSLDQVRRVVLRSSQDSVSGRTARVTVGDVATVTMAYKEPGADIRSSGFEAVAVNATRETGANVIEVMTAIRAAVAELNADALPDRGLLMEQLYDETVYINSAIDLVTQNIWVGGILAAIILLVFLRSVRATLVVALAIPVSVVASFVAMAAMGRSLNVVSLAGIAFAVGMVVDAAIVVLENIYRLRQQGQPIGKAAYHGAAQVWGAILVSALTTVMVFIPILIMELEVGQLFRDIAVAISVAVLLSLLVSITVVPALANWLLSHDIADPSRRLVSLPLVDAFGKAFMKLVNRLTRAMVSSRRLALVMVVSVTAVAGTVTYMLIPKLEYLPEGNRNFVFGMLFPPPGYNLETMKEMAGRVETAVRPLWASETGPESAPGEPPKIENFFFVATNNRTFMGASAVDSQRAGELLGPLTGPIYREPGTFGFFTQPSIFGRGVGGTRAVDLDITGPDLEQVIAIAQQAAGMVSQILPTSEGNQLRPRPGLELGAPEIRVEPDAVHLSDNGVTARELGLTVDAFNDGLRVDEITYEGKLIDLMLTGPDRYASRTQGINNLPVVTSSGTILPLSSLARIDVTAGPTEIRHTERVRTITLTIRPNSAIPLETALEKIEAEVIKPLKAQGLPDGVRLQMTGTAEKLAATWAELQVDLLIALVIVFLVMAVLFESFLYPLIIMFAVPLATAGGLIGYSILAEFRFQTFNMLTILGFVILIGIVVNNAILIVHQTLHHIRAEGMAAAEAIVEATNNRVRPIFMSTLTSVVGMLPLVVFPGAGSEIYSGLGSVVVGGLALSAVLTLTIVPPLMTLIIGLMERPTKTAPAVAD